MAENQRFMTYTQIEKASRKIMSRCTSARRKRRGLGTEYRRLRLRGAAAPGNDRSEGPTLLR
jgi:hypothetical protein